MIPDPIVDQDAWEWMWAPYDTAVYTAVLEQINPDDIVLEIGSGDLRLARQIAHRAQKIYAIERNKALVTNLEAELPANCHLIVGDGRLVPFPEDVTVAVLLMRHCTHLHLYWTKLTAVSCSKLITNARWGMDVEIIDLQGPRSAYNNLSMGWYACWCGNTGFVPGRAEKITDTLMDTVSEVVTCPACMDTALSNICQSI